MLVFPRKASYNFIFHFYKDCLPWENGGLVYMNPIVVHRMILPLVIIINSTSLRKHTEEKLISMVEPVKEFDLDKTFNYLSASGR